MSLAGINYPVLIVGGVVAYALLNVLVALYGRDKGYPFFPIYVASWFLGFPLVLLVVTVAAARREQR
jgi:hypothetical protein